MSSNYFSSVNRKRYAQKWFYVVQGLGVITLGLLLWIAPTSTTELILVVAGVALLCSGIGGWYAYFRHKTPSTLALQTKIQASLQLASGLVILLFPVFAASLLVWCIIIALLLRVILISLVFINDNEAPVTQRRWMVVSWIVTVMIVVVALASLRDPDGSISFLLGLFLLIQGFELLRHADSMANQVQTERSYLKQKHPEKTELGSESGSNRAWLAVDPGRYKKVVIISPHPDDLEGFVGGLVLKITAPITSVVMAGGNKGVWEKKYQQMVKDKPQEYIKLRLAESSDAAKILGITEVLYAGYRDRKVKYSPEAVEKILHLLTELKPDLIVSFEYQKWLNMYNHPDHVATAQIVKSAVKKYAAQGRVFDYLLTSTWLPNRFLDVSDVRQIKIDALAKHVTQQDLNSIIFPWFEKFFTRLWGLFTNSQYTEGYRKV